MPKTMPYLRQLLMQRHDWMEQRLYEKAAQNGYGDITPAMVRLLALLANGRPQGLSDLARRLGVSRQAVHRLANEVAALGYVEFVDSDEDARVKLLRYTQKGWRMAESAEAELGRIEQRLTQAIGAEQLATLKELLAQPWSAEETTKRKR